MTIETYHDLISLSMLIITTIEKGKDKGHPITDHEGSQGNRGIAVLFM
jgi:hypothetical protein